MPFQTGATLSRGEMGKARRTAILFFMGVMVFNGVCAAGQPASPASDTAAASESWQKEFDDICHKTQDAMNFSVEETKVLVQRCDALEPQIEKLDETRKKVYLKRLKQCRGLFTYVLESKTKDKK
jgi:hypothetical protein